MGKFIDMTGQTYGDWTVLGKSKRANNQGTYWICQCSCGTIRPVMGVALRAGRSTGCGCARTEKVRQIMRAPAREARTAGAASASTSSAHAATTTSARGPAAAAAAAEDGSCSAYPNARF